MKKKMSQKGREKKDTNTHTHKLISINGSIFKMRPLQLFRDKLQFVYFFVPKDQTKIYN